MRLLNIENLSHEFPGRPLFKKASLMVCAGEHIGLVGPNGCGKSTLLGFLTGQSVPDSGRIEFSSGLKIGWLDQNATLEGSATATEYLLSLFGELRALEKSAEALYARIPALSEQEQLAAAARAQGILDILLEKDFYNIPRRVENVLTGLGFSEADRDKRISHLSGGMKTKLIFAKLLLSENDLLLLDEPTNHLDRGYTDWLAGYLARLDRAYIVISHDRAFLNKISGKIVEIAGLSFREYAGDYEFYLKDRERRDAIQAERHRAQQKFVDRTEEYIGRLGKGNFKGSGRKNITPTRVTWMKKMLAGLERIKKPDEIVLPDFEFAHRKGVSGRLLTLSSLEAGYGGVPVLPPVSLSLDAGEKLVFRGFNGIGKTTLLKTVCGVLPPVAGEFSMADGAEIVFLRQEEDCDSGPSSLREYEKRGLGIKKRGPVTALEFAKEHFPEKGARELSAALASCGLGERLLFSRVSTLSGGEMTRLRMALAMLKPADLLVLDEPTNHLDVYSKEVLLRAVRDFGGAVLMTSHDVNFDVSFATRVINLEELFE